MAKPIVKRVKSDHLTLPFLEGGTRIDISAQELNGDRTIELSGDLSGEVQTSFRKNETVSIPAEIKPGTVTQEKLGSDVIETIEEIRENLDTKADRVAEATENNLAALDENGNLKDSGIDPSDLATAEQGSKADSAVQTIILNGNELQKDGTKVNLGNLKTKQTAKTFAGESTKTVTSVSQNANGEISVTAEDIPTVGDNGAAKGLMTEAMLQLLNGAEQAFTMEYVESRHCLRISKQIEGIPSNYGD